MRRALVAGCVLVACASEPPGRLWPDRSDVLDAARQRANNPTIVQATDPEPRPARVGFVATRAGDRAVGLWTQLDAGPDAPQALWVSGPRADQLGPQAEPRLSPSEGARAVQSHLGAGRLDCAFMPSDHFLTGVFSGLPLVGVARLPGMESGAHLPVLLRAPGVPEESPRELKGRSIGVRSAEPFHRAAMQDWARRMGLSRRGNTMTELPADLSPAAALAGRVDYLLTVPALLPAHMDTAASVDISRTVASDALYQTLLVCSRERIADHRRDLVEHLSRWIAQHPETAPLPVERESIQKLSQLLLRSGLYQGDPETRSLVDLSLVVEAQQRAVLREQAAQGPG